MALIGVITGDIVDSTKIAGDDRTKLLSVLKLLLSQTSGRRLDEMKNSRLSTCG